MTYKEEKKNTQWLVKVLNLRAHVGAQIGAQVFTSVDSKNQKCDMWHDVHAGVVHVINKDPSTPDKHNYGLPIGGNVASMQYEKESFSNYMLERFGIEV